MMPVNFNGNDDIIQFMEILPEHPGFDRMLREIKRAVVQEEIDSAARRREETQAERWQQYLKLKDEFE